MFQYSAAELKSFRLNAASIPSEAIKVITSLDFKGNTSPPYNYTPIKGLVIKGKTKRGTKGGTRRQHVISTVCTNRSDIQYKDNAVNQNNLITVSQLQTSAITSDKNVQKLSMCSMNCRSVRNKTAFLNDFITENDFDCVAVTETWLSSTEAENNQTLGSLIPSTYKFLHIPRNDGRGGGVAFMYKNHYKARLDNGFTAKSFESMSVLMDVGSFTFRFVIIYRIPPSPANKLKTSQFLEELSDYLELAATLSGRLVLAGDFNVHWDSPDNTERIELASMLDAYDLVQHVIGPTHSDGHTLDLVITRNTDNLVSECTVGNFVSDHNAIHVCFNCCKDHPERKRVERRSLKTLDTTAFAQDIKTAVADPLSDSLDGIVGSYNNSLKDLLDRHAPLKQHIVVDRENKQWVTQEIIDKKRERRKAEQKWRKSGQNDHRLEYKRLCNDVKELVLSAKSNFYVNEIQSCDGDQRKLYKVVDTLLGRSKPATLPSADSNQALAESFNTFFTSKIATIRQKLSDLEPTTGQLSFESFDQIQKPAESSISDFNETTIDEVTSIVKRSSSATCSLDALPTSLVKEHIADLAPIITKIVNMSLSSGLFPSDMKAAIVQPLLKKSYLDSEELKNYRPVSNLSFVSKVIEKVIASRILKHMEENQLLETFQSAYKKAHSTETALLRVHNDITCAMDRQKGVFLILLDLSAAFDTVDHNILLSFLQNNIGIHGTALSLLRSYLSDRTQCVSINGVFSELNQLAFGVPQGSVLGPIIFCTYTLPVGAILRQHGLQYHIYADDTQVYCTSDLKDTEENLQRVSRCISDIRTWMISNKLKINDDKTEFLFVRSPRLSANDNVTITVGSEDITPSKSAKNLGVMFDNHMDMGEHIAAVCRSSYLQLRNIRSIRNLLTDDTAAALVHSLVSSKLDYCNSLLYDLPDTKIKRLQRIQNIAARIVAQLPKSCHITPVLKELHWLPVRGRIEFKILLFVYRCVNNLAPEYLSALLKSKQHSYGTRSKTAELLETPRTKRKMFGDRSFSTCGPRAWNTISLDIRKKPTIELFKKALKTHLFRKYLETKV